MTVGRAVCLGLNVVDTGSPPYAGAFIPVLAGCVNDARSMCEVLESRGGFQTPAVYLDRKATRAALAAALADAARDLRSGDLFVLTYSGHGMRTAAATAWVLADGPFASGDLWHAWHAFAPGVRVVVVSDSCYSGRATRAAYRVGPVLRDRGLDPATAVLIASRAALRGPARDPGPPDCAVLLLSGCRDDQTSLDGSGHGLFTESLLGVLPTVDGDYHALHAAAAAETSRRATGMGHDQDPQLFLTGDPVGCAVLAGSGPPFFV